MRCRIQMTVPYYKSILGKIVSKSKGLIRQEIMNNYDIVNDEFVKKNRERIKSVIDDNKPPTGIVAKDPSEELDKYKEWISSIPGFIEGLTSTVGAQGTLSQTKLNDIQYFLTKNIFQFLCLNKTRQFGYSFVIAAKSLAKAMLTRKTTSIFVSYNEDESKEKIMYARELYESMPIKYKLARKLKYDNKTSLVFEKTGPEGAETRILSFPQRELRGKGGNVDIYLDEFAHCIHARKIYKSALPVLSRGVSSISIGSSPSGKGNLFYEIMSNMDNLYKEYARINVFWWDVPEFCTDVKVARLTAPYMLTDDRVNKYATDKLKAIRRSMPLDDFQQEYECEYLDESYSYYPWDLIMSCVPVYSSDSEELEFDTEAEKLKDIDSSNIGKGIEFYTDFDFFMDAVLSGIIKGPILLGFDVGRTENASELIFIEETPDRGQIVRCNITFKNVPMPDQREQTLNMIEKLGSRLIKCGIDPNGIGRNLAEDLERKSYDLVKQLAFNNNDWKAEAAKRMKYRMEMKKIIYPPNRALLSQIHSIKRELLPSGLWRFNAEENAKHHGDKFWAIVAASEMGYPIINSEEKIAFDSRLFKKVVDKKDVRRLPQVRSTMRKPLNAVVIFNPYKDMGMDVFMNIPAPEFPFSNSAFRPLIDMPLIR